MKKTQKLFSKNTQKTSVKIPLLASNLQAGFPSPLEEFIDTALDLNEALITHPAATFFVRVEGNSMEDAHIIKGDLLIVDRSIDPRSGQIVVAVLNGEFTVKRLVIKKGKLFLKPENSKFPSIAISEDSEFSIFGVVTYVIHKT